MKQTGRKTNHKVKTSKRRNRKAAVSHDGKKTVRTDEQKVKRKKSMVADHKETLEQLRHTDPKFYEFLKEEDAELFDFDVSDDEEEEDDEQGQEKEEHSEEGDVHSEQDVNGPSNDELSDSESGVAGGDNFHQEEEEDDSTRVAITPKLATQWHDQLFTHLDASNCRMEDVSETLNHLVDALRAVVLQAGAEPDVRTRYRIDDSAGFNAVVRLCFSVYPLVWQKIYGIDFASLSKAKRMKLRPRVKPYLQNLTAFMGTVQNPEVLNVVLKHVTHVADYYSLFNSLSRTAVKVLTTIWSTKEEDARLLAFVSIMKLVRGSPQTFVPLILKKFYLAYVRNTKLVTPSTWCMINFMQRSFAELCGFEKKLTYQFAFVYIRQLAIHLRNAIVTKKKDKVKAVYNWQFIQCLYLWARVMSTNRNDDVLQPLVYPLIQIALGCIRLIPTPKYIPLRFHCIRAILVLIQEAGVYVPLLPTVLEVFRMVDFKKKHQRQSVKPLDFDCILKLSESQLQENSFKVAVVEGAVELTLEIMNVHANSSAFPELAFVCCSQLKSFSKSCHIPSLTRPAKELADTIMKHAAWLERHRTATALDLSDQHGTASAFEVRMSFRSDSPLGKFFETFKTMKERERKLKLDTASDSEPKEYTAADVAPGKRLRLQQTQESEKRVKRRKKVKKEPLSGEAKDAYDEDVVQDMTLADLDD